MKEEPKNIGRFHLGSANHWSRFQGFGHILRQYPQRCLLQFGEKVNRF
jgi:hypothetical protein